jgi:alkanesulfonate monooxygenase
MPPKVVWLKVRWSTSRSFVRLPKRTKMRGFDRVLIGYFSSAPDVFQIAAYAAQQTECLKFLLAHRPGSSRRRSRTPACNAGPIHRRAPCGSHITGGADHEQAKDGDFLDKQRATSGLTSTLSF